MALWFSFFKGNSEASAASGASPGSAIPSTPSGNGLPRWVAQAEKNPGDPLVRRRAGEELERRGDSSGAVAQWLASADLYTAAGLPLKALAVLAAALRLDPTRDDVRARIARLDLPFFAELSAQEAEAVARHLEVRKFVAGEILLREKEVAGALSFLMDGVVRILARTHGPRPVKIGSLRPGDLFGLGSALDGIASVATLAAEEPGELLVWPRAALDAVCREMPGVRKALASFRSAVSLRCLDGSLARLRSVL